MEEDTGAGAGGGVAGLGGGFVPEVVPPGVPEVPPPVTGTVLVVFSVGPGMTPPLSGFFLKAKEATKIIIIAIPAI